MTPTQNVPGREGVSTYLKPEVGGQSWSRTGAAFPLTALVSVQTRVPRRLLPALLSGILREPNGRGNRDLEWGWAVADTQEGSPVEMSSVKARTGAQAQMGPP